MVALGRGESKKGLGDFLLNSEEPEHCLFLIAAVAAGVDADCWEFASYAPSFDGERGDSENFCYFTDGKKIW